MERNCIDLSLWRLAPLVLSFIFSLLHWRLEKVLEVRSLEKMNFKLENGREEILESEAFVYCFYKRVRVGGRIDESTRGHLAVEARWVYRRGTIRVVVTWNRRKNHRCRKPFYE